MFGWGKIWFRLPPKARTFFTLAIALMCGFFCLLGEGLYFRARATLVQGIVVDHGSRGRPIVAYSWGGRVRRHEESGPSQDLAVGTAIGVYVPPEGPPNSRLDWTIGLLFLPSWFCLMPATFFTMCGVVETIRGRDNPLGRLVLLSLLVSRRG
jgi:hypothetical protein